MIDLTIGGDAPLGEAGRRALIEAGLAAGTATARHARLERLEAFYRGLEYAHQTVGWDGFSADAAEAISPVAVAPRGQELVGASCRVRSKRPTAPTRLCPFVVDRFTGLLFGLHRTPEVSVAGDAEADDFLRESWRRFGFWRAMVSARGFGGAMGSALVLVTLREGAFGFEAINPRHVVEVVWADPKGRLPSGVLIQYAFSREVDALDDDGRPTGGTRTVDFIYRRIVDEYVDLHFVPTPLEATGGEAIRLEIDAQKTRVHKLGTFPGVWIQNLPDDEDLDGIPDCEGTYQGIEEIDRQIAQQGRALLANMDPTLVIGSDPKQARINAGPIRKGSDNAIDVGPGGTATYLEMTGSAITASRDYTKDLRRNVLDRCQCIAVDPADISGAAQSAKAIEYVYAPMLEKAGRLREQYGAAIERLAEATLGLARLWGSAVQYATPRRVAIAFRIPPKPDGSPRTPGMGGLVQLAWGPYFEATPGDIQQAVSTISTLFAAGIMDIETAARAIAPLLKIKDVDGFVRRAAAAAAAKEARLAVGGGFPGYGP